MPEENKARELQKSVLEGKNAIKTLKQTLEGLRGTTNYLADFSFKIGNAPNKIKGAGLGVAVSGLLGIGVVSLPVVRQHLTFPKIMPVSLMMLGGGTLGGLLTPESLREKLERNLKEQKKCIEMIATLDPNNLDDRSTIIILQEQLQTLSFSSNLYRLKEAKAFTNTDFLSQEEYKNLLLPSNTPNNQSVLPPSDPNPPTTY